MPNPLDPRTAPLEAVTRAVAEELDPTGEDGLWKDCDCWNKARTVRLTVHPDCHGTGRVPVADLEALLVAARGAGYHVLVRSMDITNFGPWRATVNHGEVTTTMPEYGEPPIATPTEACIRALAAALGAGKETT